LLSREGPVTEYFGWTFHGQHRALPFTHWVCNPGTAAPRPCFRDYRKKEKKLIGRAAETS